MTINANEMKRIRGRPKGGASKPAMLSARITAELRELLDAESEETGKSVGEIVCQRLVKSFGEPHPANKALGSENIRVLAYIVSQIATVIESQTKCQWDSDPYTNAAVGAAVKSFVDRLRTEDWDGSPNQVSREGKKPIPPESHGERVATAYYQQFMFAKILKNSRDRMPGFEDGSVSNFILDRIGDFDESAMDFWTNKMKVKIGRSKK